MIKKKQWDTLGTRFWFRCIGVYIVLDMMISFLFYDSVIVFLVLLPMIFIYIKFAVKEEMKRRYRDHKLQFREAMTAMYTMTAAGYSLESSIRGVPDELKICYSQDTWIVKEFNKMVEKLNINIAPERCLEDFAEESKDEDITNFYEIICIAKRFGGSMSMIIKMAIDRISRRIETECEIMTMMAGRRHEFTIMTCIPIGIILYMRLTSPELMAVLYTNVSGRLIMTGCLSAYLAAVLWGRYVTQKAVASV